MDGWGKNMYMYEKIFMKAKLSQLKINNSTHVLFKNTEVNDQKKNLKVLNFVISRKQDTGLFRSREEAAGFS